MDPAADGPAVNKQKRTRRACDTCFDVKARCDGNLPCARCKASHRLCQYSRIVKKRGPRPRNVQPSPPTQPNAFPPPGYSSAHDAAPVDARPGASVSGTAERSMSTGCSPGSISSPAIAFDSAPTPRPPNGFAVPAEPQMLEPHSQASPYFFEYGRAGEVREHLSTPHAYREWPTLSGERQRQRLDESECRYPCLKPILATLEGVLSPDLACDLLDHYFTRPNTSLFTTASPYVLDPVIRLESLLRDISPRETSPTLLMTILWVCVCTANIEALFAPGRRNAVGEKLRQMVMTRLRIRHSWCEDLHTGPADLCGTSNATSPLKLPCNSLDDLLTLILVTIVISGSDVKTVTIQWWHRTVRLARDMKLNAVDPKENNNPPRICSNVPCTCSRDRRSMSAETYAEYQEEQRRTMWLLFALDRHWALCYNCMPLILDQDLQVYTPLPDSIWNSPEFHLSTRAYERSYGPPLTVSGTGFYEFFLPLMAILGDIIHAHHMQRHPRFGKLDWRSSVSMIEALLTSCSHSVDALPTRSNCPQCFHAHPSPERPVSQDAPTPIARVGAAEDPKICATVQLYARFILHVLYVLLHGQWDALSMISPRAAPVASTDVSKDYRGAAEIEISDWITSPQFASCASHAIMASESLSLILQSDPELAFTPYLFGIYLLQGSFIMLLFVHRMPEVEGGRQESVERACETIIRAHEISVTTLSVEFQKDFRKVFRAALNRVKEHQASAKHDSSSYCQHHRTSPTSTSPNGHDQHVRSPSWQYRIGQGSQSADIWRNVLGLYRWKSGARGLAV